MYPMLGTDDPLTPVGYTHVVEYFNPMRMNFIIINGPGNGVLINGVNLWNLKYIINTLYLLKRPHKVLHYVMHGKRESIVNNNRYVISIKLRFSSLTDMLGHARNTGDVHIVYGGHKSGIIVDMR